MGEEAIERLRARARTLGMFAGDPPVAVGSAPGRLDVMGGIADYSGSLVLQLPLLVRATALAAPRADGEIHVLSVGAGGAGDRVFTLPLSFVRQAGYERLRALLRANRCAWFGYLMGIVPVLGIERGQWPRIGFDLVLGSDVPEGKGVSSSAAVEVASATALVRALDLQLAEEAPAADPWSERSRRDLALLCQLVENRVAGAACGVMDQMTAACGRDGELLRLLCQPAEIQGHVPVPEGFAFWGIDSGVRHAVAGADYTSVRTGAFMGFRILAELAGLPVELADGRAEFAHPRWGRHLANVPVAEWGGFAARVPATMRGAEFLQRYGGTSDPVTRVDPERTYAVRQPAAHPIHEHERVRRFAEALPRVHEAGVPEMLGDLMFQSHASYSACGLGHAATDALVAAVRAAGPAAGLFGAKITGGGSGGTVAVFGRADAEPHVRALAGGRLVLTTTGRTPS